MEDFIKNLKKFYCLERKVAESTKYLGLLLTSFIPKF